MADLQGAIAVHRAGVRDALFSAWPVPGGIALAGEVDVCNEAVLRSCRVAAVSAQVGEGSFVVDLSRLGFLDVSGVRALVTGTSAHRLNGVTVLLRQARPAVARILGVLDVNRERGFVLQGKQ